ncbi:MAG: diacylglycerol kinase family protein [Bacteroidota bacterium]
MKILFFINPISGGIDKSEVVEDIKSLCELHHINFKTYFTKKVNNSDLSVLLSEFIPDRIVVVGGDGTMNCAVQKMAYLGVPFGLISLGSANGTAKEVSLSTNSLDALTDAVFSNKFINSDVIKINGRLCVHLADIGTNAEIVSNFEREPERGFMAYAKHLIAAMVDSKEKDFIIESNGIKYTWRGYMLSFANASKYGSGIIINPGGSISDGYFELCNIKDFSIEAILMMGLSKISEELPLLDYIQQVKTKEAIVTTNEPYLLQIDGEIIGEFSKFEVRIYENYFRFVVP